MATSTRVVVLFLFLLAGAEAERINSAATLATAARAQIQAHGFKGRSSAGDKTMDLDWPGCGSKTDWLFGPRCSDVEGCEWHKLWLDTPRQSCRFSDGYKLRPENVQRFLPVELARLEEKSATFAKSGCLFGGWFAKCYRRMRQIIRLLKYVRRAVSDAKSDPSHPAHALAASEETSQKLLRAADNLAAGFRKLQGTDGVGEAFGMMAEGPESLRAAAAAVEGAENRSLTDEEKVAMENTRAVEGMLKAAGTNLDDEQRAELYAQIEAGGPMAESEDELDADVEDLVVEEEWTWSAPWTRPWARPTTRTAAACRSRRAPPPRRTAATTPRTLWRRRQTLGPWCSSAPSPARTPPQRCRPAGPAR